MTQHTLLIISDETEFVRVLTGRWQAERHVPAITAVSSEIWNRARPEDYDLVIVGAVRKEAAASLFESLQSSPAVLCVTRDQNSAADLRNLYPHFLTIPRRDGWVDALVLLATEMLRRRDATARAQRAELRTAQHQAHATLGRYMLEMRHNVNDALTSMLGNADLLLLEPGMLSVDSRENIKTIHVMALRLNEIMQRFSSLANEMRASETESQSATFLTSHSPVERR
jgi:signal transduction histidine kinase